MILGSDDLGPDSYDEPNYYSGEDDSKDMDDGDKYKYRDFTSTTKQRVS